MNNQFAFYLLCLLGIIVGVVIVKKVASCLIKGVLLAIILALLAFFWLGQ